MRLALWVAALIVGSAAVTFVVVYRDAGTQLRAQIDRDLRGETSQLLQTLGMLRGRSAADIAVAARQYVGAQPYSTTSTLLFVLVPGMTPVSNHPELFGSPSPDPGETRGDQRSENRLGRALLSPALGFSTRRLADVGDFRLLERVATLGPVTIVAGAGEPLDTVARAQTGIARAFIVAGAVALVLALLASYLASARISAPLRRMARVAARVDAGDLQPRIDPIPGRPGDEVHVLADAFNNMLDRLAGAFAGQRAFVADASHELRTPLTVIRGQIEVLAAQRDPPAAEVQRVAGLVQAEIARITRMTDDMLLLAQTERREFLTPVALDLPAFVHDLWDGIAPTAARRFELGSVPGGSLTADPDRLTQALRNLIRNAIEHTQPDDGLVRLDVTPGTAGFVAFVISDDGPGIAAADRERIFERFHRTDPARSRETGGAGLGLAIVRAVADAHGGRVRVLSSNGRGARFELALPSFRPR
jgi:signal transduction histidine kinase